MYITKISLLSTYGKLVQRHNKNYVYPSQETLLMLLKRHYRISISRRALNYHLSDLRKQGLIKTIKRTARTAQGQIEQLASATCLTIKGCRLLFKLGSSWALRHLKKLRDKYLPSIEPPSHRSPQISIPRERPSWVRPGATSIEIMSSPEYLEKYPKMRDYVEKKIFNSKKNKENSP